MTTQSTTERHSPAANFNAFHEANPRVYALLLALVLEYLRDTGHSKVGFSLIYGAARWKWAIETRDEASAHKLNNNYAPFYARMIMGRVPGLGQVFDLRTSDADKWAHDRGYPCSIGWDCAGLQERTNSRGEVVLEQVSR